MPPSNETAQVVSLVAQVVGVIVCIVVARRLRVSLVLPFAVTAAFVIAVLGHLVIVADGQGLIFGVVLYGVLIWAFGSFGRDGRI